MVHPLALLLTLALSTPAAHPPGAVDSERDSDRDGLSDFHELHKYRTDPRSKDSDGDGIPDGDWDERREFTYVVRTVVQVLKPVTPAYLDDDFQDVRVLDEREDRFELEVVHYPFSTAPEALPEGTRSRRAAAHDRELAPWLAAGPTSDCDDELTDELTAALAADGIDGIDVGALDDAELVRRAAQWLVRHAGYVDGFTTFSTAFDDAGRPYLPDELRAGGAGVPGPEDWEAEISAKGMFRRATRGSCTSSAIYLSGCLRALGIPTRTVLCIPLFDAGDEREWAMVRAGIEQPHVRQTVLAAMRGLEGSWTSHTFNEVWIDGRWYRLDYAELAVGILRQERFGLLTHVATFRDWADARASETIGRRQTLNLRDAWLDGANPYSMLSVSDRVGPHCTLELPAAASTVARIDALTWTDDPDLPEDVRGGIERKNRFGLLARISGLAGSDELALLLERIDRRVYLHAEGRPRLSVGFDPACWWYRGDHALVYLPFGPGDRRDLASGVEYRVEFTDEALEAPEDLRVAAR
jgi:transglutaminase-like putative cysteine protease